MPELPAFSKYCDAGTDAAQADDAAMEAKSCEPRGDCIPNEPDGFEPPQPFWIGPHDKAKLFCPDDVGSFGSLAYADLQPVTASCPACVCGPIEGTCSPRPGQIQIRAGSCAEAQTPTVDFGAPAGWDGSCTSAGALPAGAECPPGSGIPCAQSVYASALPDPVEGCKPEPVPVPKATADAPWWGQVALSCSASPPAPAWTCEAADTTCQWKLPPGYRHCARREGVHACVEGSPYAERFVVYPYDAIKDSRGCSPCECKASGGACYGSFRVYEDEACSVPLIVQPKDSIQHSCDPVTPPGGPIGSKEITDLQYAPGKCQPSGGAAFGTVELDDARAVTWCCMAETKAPDL
ncbi:hypothetical protein [Polyangium sorediatum]|uniref:Uncharacterized protein n=1 Tax=Polyangium sorediatum TaxID=889274 RepID=A0ABT6NL54_9BACT|nr:hypothetical protein [Polyangium sorediatum]MDI1429039.1 hypothetical protein [Polyangium sorediatum]